MKKGLAVRNQKERARLAEKEAEKSERKIREKSWFFSRFRAN